MTWTPSGLHSKIQNTSCRRNAVLWNIDTLQKHTRFILVVFHPSFGRPRFEQASLAYAGDDVFYSPSNLPKRFYILRGLLPS